MKSFEFDRWDHGRLTVNCQFSELLRLRGMTTCAAIWEFSLTAEPIKMLRTDRVTLHFTLTDADGSKRTFYMKRHGRSSWKESIKPWLHGQQPLHGAQPEWDALLAFHRHGLPTMTPVACGRLNHRSFLITAGLDGCRKLSEAFPAADCGPSRRRMISQTARIARMMHASRLHHQDFYLGHLLESEKEPQETYVIDLGRVRTYGRLFAKRWIVKDLAQLNFSAKDARLAERVRFLREYLGRKLQPCDRGLIHGILAKSKHIARHSARHGL